MMRFLTLPAALATTLIVFNAPSTAESPGMPVPPSIGPDDTGRGQEQSRYISGVDLVTLDVCARDVAGRFLSDLKTDDFLVLENGKPQLISFVLPASAVPLRAVLLIDRSLSMSGAKLERATEAAELFSRHLQPHDQLEIIGFNHRAERVHAFRDDRTQVPVALTSIDASGTTSLYDALLVAADELVRARRDAEPESREAIIVLSDGEDTTSRVGFEEVLPVLRRSGALVYAVSLREGAKGEWLGASWPLLALARDTGARALGVANLDALPALYAEIGEEVRHLYRIGYVSSDARRDGQWRSVSVRVPSRDARVRTRAGYYASREPVRRNQP